LSTSACTVDVVTTRHEKLEARCRQLEADNAVKDRTIEHLHGREKNATEQGRAVEHLHFRSQKSCAELEARVATLEQQCAGLADSLQSAHEQVRVDCPPRRPWLAVYDWADSTTTAGE
jgi:uncharacterized coiled-coil protein SlyX